MIGLETVLLATHAIASWHFTAKSGYFEQCSDSDSVTTNLTNWGLDDSYTWDSLVSTLKSKTKSSHGKYYKLVFFARHGEAWHNVIKDQVGEDAWEEIGGQDSYDGITLFDDDLTLDGVSGIESLQVAWQRQIHDNGMVTPDSYYVSPLQRTLHTFQLTWGSDLKGEVVESLRERYGAYTSYERHNKTWIADNYPQVSFEHGFSEEDELWTTTKEDKIHVQDRCRDFLKYLFKNDDNYVISVTSHSGTIQACLTEIGHPDHYLSPGQVLPVVLEAQAHLGLPHRTAIK